MKWHLSVRNLCAIALSGAQVILIIFVTIIIHSALLAEDATKDLLAAQIREQGYRCEKAISAHRDSNLSKPDEAVWILKCEMDTYRLRLVPDMAAHVERLNE